EKAALLWQLVVQLNISTFTITFLGILVLQLTCPFSSISSIKKALIHSRSTPSLVKSDTSLKHQLSLSSLTE
ncbi:MAG: hypothetical protein ABWX61_04710, partial [Paenisporosarcina sp.]